MDRIVVEEPSKLPRYVYWLSLLLLIIGGRTLIDPSNRSPGETVQIYITLAAFEIYAWLLLVLARWQHGRHMRADVARSGLFVVGLQGLMFVALDELQMVDASAGLIAAIVVTLLAAAKLAIGKRWLDVPLTRPLTALVGASVLVMAACGVVLSLLPEGGPERLAAGLALCWLTAGIAAAHGLLAAWRGDDIRAKDRAGEDWWVGWLVSGAFLAMLVVQLISCRRGFFIDFRLALLSPIAAAVGISAVALTIAVDGRRDIVAWLLILTVALIAGLGLASTPVDEEPGWMRAFGGLAVHAAYPPAGLAAVLAIATGLKLRSRLLLGLGVGLLLAGGIALLVFVFAAAIKAALAKLVAWAGEVIDYVLSWRYAQATFLIAGAFVTLGLGAFLQRRAAAKADEAVSEDEDV